MLHNIFQLHHIPPDEVYKKPKGVRRFMYASMILRAEADAKLNKS
jgi:hypothetical protein